MSALDEIKTESAVIDEWPHFAANVSVFASHNHAVASFYLRAPERIAALVDYIEAAEARFQHIAEVGAKAYLNATADGISTWNRLQQARLRLGLAEKEAGRG